MLYQGRGYAIEACYFECPRQGRRSADCQAFIETSRDRLRLPEYRHIIRQTPARKHDVSECHLECVEGETFKIRIRIHLPRYRRWDLAITCYIDGQEVAADWVKNGQMSWTFKKMSMEDDFGEVCVANMKFAKLATTDKEEEAEVDHDVLMNLGRISLTFEEGRLYDTGELRWSGGSAPQAIGLVHEKHKKISSTVVGSDPVPVPRTQSSVHRFEPTDDPNIVRMTWMYSTRDGLEIKKIIGKDEKPAPPHYEDSYFSDHNSDSDDGDDFHSSDEDAKDNKPGPSRLATGGRKRRPADDSDAEDDEDYEPEDEEEDVKPKRESKRPARGSRGRGQGEATPVDEGTEEQLPRSISTRTRSKKYSQPDEEDDSGSDGCGASHVGRRETGGDVSDDERPRRGEESGLSVGIVKQEAADRGNRPPSLDFARMGTATTVIKTGEVIDLTEDD